LKQIDDPPLVLHVRGNVDAFAQPGIAVVGTRYPTPKGWAGPSGWHAISRTAAW